MDFPDIENFSHNGFSKNIFEFFKSKKETLVGNLKSLGETLQKPLSFYIIPIHCRLMRNSFLYLSQAYMNRGDPIINKSNLLNLT